MVNFIMPGDLETIFVNLFAGDRVIFTFLFIMFIAMLAGRFRMPNSIVLISLALIPIIIVGYFTDLWIMVAVMIAFAVPYILIRFLSR